MISFASRFILYLTSLDSFFSSIKFPATFPPLNLPRLISSSLSSYFLLASPLFLFRSFMSSPFFPPSLYIAHFFSCLLFYTLTPLFLFFPLSFNFYSCFLLQYSPFFLSRPLAFSLFLSLAAYFHINLSFFFFFHSPLSYSLASSPPSVTISFPS